MPDWDMLHERKRKEVNLGIAKKGAFSLLKNKGEIPEWKSYYKKTVKLLYNIYEELDKEILQNGEVKAR